MAHTVLLHISPKRKHLYKNYVYWLTIGSATCLSDVIQHLNSVCFKTFNGEKVYIDDVEKIEDYASCMVED